MGYMHISNLYSSKAQDILHFKTVFACEKIDGTSAHISWKQENDILREFGLKFFSGGEKYDKFVALFDQEELANKFREKFGDQLEVTVYGEAYAGKCQGMSKTYGDKLKFIAFEVKIGDSWLSVPQAADCATSLGFEFVDWVEIPTTCSHPNNFETKGEGYRQWMFEPINPEDGSVYKDDLGMIHRPDRLCFIDHERDKPSTQALRNGCGDDKLREGVVLHPPFECTKNNGERVLCKHKREEFRETKTPRVVDPAKKLLLEGAQKVADEYVTAQRLEHVLNRLISSREKKEIGIEDTRDVITLMIEDVNREGQGEFEPSPAINKSIGAATAKMFKTHLQSSIRS